MSPVATPRDASPFNLIQEELRDEPWRLLVACIMLNLTNIVQVRPIIALFFEKYPDCTSVTPDDEAAIAELIRPLGLYNRRAKSIVKMSLAYQRGWSVITDLPGVGKYAADSYRIFCEGRLDDVQPTDKKLLKYIGWARER